MTAPTFVIPKRKAIRGMICGIPSFGMVSVGFMQNVTQQCPPINFGMGYMTPQNCRWDWTKNEPYDDFTENGKYIPVDEGRNIIAYHALKNQVEWVFFRDDDTMAPPDSINKLWSLARYAADNGMKVPVVGGVYYSKQQPPHSLILCDDHLGGYENYVTGEVVKCMAIGMGITLIHTSIFAEMPPPWFKTVNGLVNNDIQDIAPGGARMTEDVYFCKKAAALGHEIWCDTSVQGAHEDFENRTLYYRHPTMGIPCWQKGNVCYFYPAVGHPEFTKMQEQRRVSQAAEIQDEVKLNMGSGPLPKEGYVNIDLTCKGTGILNMDARNVPALKAKFGKVTKILAEEFIEHLSIGEAVPMLKGWVELLQPGGEIELVTPDVKWAIDNLQRYLEDDIDSRTLNDAYARFYGARRWEGDRHELLYGEKQLRQLLETVGLTNVEISPKDNLNLHEPARQLIQRSLRAVGRKPIVVAPSTPTNGVASDRYVNDDSGGVFAEGSLVKGAA